MVSALERGLSLTKCVSGLDFYSKDEMCKYPVLPSTDTL